MISFVLQNCVMSVYRTCNHNSVVRFIHIFFPLLDIFYKTWVRLFKLNFKIFSIRVAFKKSLNFIVDLNNFLFCVFTMVKQWCTKTKMLNFVIINIFLVKWVYWFCHFLITEHWQTIKYLRKCTFMHWYLPQNLSPE